MWAGSSFYCLLQSVNDTYLTQRTWQFPLGTWCTFQQTSYPLWL